MLQPFIKENSTILYLLLLAIVCFFIGAKITERNSYEHTYSSACKRNFCLIFGLILLSIIPEHISTDDVLLEAIIVCSAIIINVFLAFSISFNDDASNITRFSFIELLVLLFLPRFSTFVTIPVTLLIIIYCIRFWRSDKFSFDETETSKKKIIEIVILCIYHLIFSILMRVYSDIDMLHWDILSVVFEETVVYTLSYLIIAIYEESVLFRGRY